jgi:hypothetical protein
MPVASPAAADCAESPFRLCVTRACADRRVAPRACAADGVYTGEWTTMALCGFIRGMGEGDGCLDRLWTKSYDDAKASGVEV